jgi:hypothetical protein
VTLRWLSRWLVMFSIGIGTALLAAAIHFVVEKLAHFKFDLIKHCILCKAYWKSG